MFNNIYRGKKVLITGNTGFKGAWLSTWLLKLGAKVDGISKDILGTKPSLFEVLALENKITYHQQNLKDAENTAKIIQETNPDFVFHLAAQAIVGTAYQDPLDTFGTNVMGTAHVLEALRLMNKPCVAVIITSDKAYDNVEWKWGYRENDTLAGKDPYSASKSAAEIVIKSYYHSFFKNEDSNVKLVSVRAGNVIGGGDWAEKRIVPDTFKAWAKKEAVEIRSPRATRPWQHVLEPLSAYLRIGQLLAKNPKIHGEPYNVGPNADQDFTVLELLEELSKYWGFAEEEEEKIIIKENPQFHEAKLLKLNCDKALYDLQWKPTLNFQQTAQLTADWYKTYYAGKEDLFEFTQKQITTYEEKAKSKNLEWTK